MEKICSISHISSISGRSEFFRDFENQNDGELKIEYPSRYENTKILREAIDEFCTLFHLPAKWKTRLVLIYDELNNNAIEHGSISSDTNICYISLTRKENNIFIRGYVEDTGNALHAKKPQDLQEMQTLFRDKDFSQHNSIRGRGLFLIIAQLVQVLEFRPSSIGGVQVYFEKSIALEEQASYPLK